MHSPQMGFVNSFVGKWLNYLTKSGLATDREVRRVGIVPGDNDLNPTEDDYSISLSPLEQAIFAGSNIFVSEMISCLMNAMKN